MDFSPGTGALGVKYDKYALHIFSSTFFFDSIVGLLTDVRIHKAHSQVFKTPKATTVPKFRVLKVIGEVDN